MKSSAKELSYRPLLWMLALALGVRAALMILYWPGVMLSFDSARYARTGGMPLFGDFWMPAGYPMLLLTLRAVCHQMWFTIVVQHLLGIGTGIFLYLAMRRLKVIPWLACIPVAVAFFSGDHLYLEHSVMADFFLTFLASTGFCAATFACTDGGKKIWFALASMLLASAALARSVGIVLLPIMALSVWFCWRGSFRQRLSIFAVATLPGLAVFGCYYTAFKLSGGQYLGLFDMRGWNLYSRVAPFADCRKFTPPEGTAILCETRKEKKRPGPFGYVWDLKSVPRKTFALGPETGKRLEAFAYAAILHQPRKYVRAVAIDLARYAFPSVGGRKPYGGQPREILSFGWRDENVEAIVVRAMKWSYGGVEVKLRAQKLLGIYQEVARVHGVTIALCFVLTLVGIWKTKDEQRLALVLFGFSAIGLYIVPVATVSYDFRYGIPPETFLVVSGTLGAAALWRDRARKTEVS